MKLKKDLFVVGLSALAAALFLGVFLQTPSPQPEHKTDSSNSKKVTKVDDLQTPEHVLRSESKTPKIGPAAKNQVATHRLSFRLFTADVSKKEISQDKQASHLRKLNKAKPLGQRFIDLSSIPNLSQFHEGMRLGIPTSDGYSYNAVVNLVKIGKSGSIRVGGSLENSKGGFALSQGPDGFRGMVRIPENNRTFMIEPGDGDKLVMVEYNLGDWECLGMPRLQLNAGGGAFQSAASLTAPVIPEFDTKPDATSVIYIDFDGELVTDSIWNNGNEIDAAPAIYAGRPLTNAHIQSVIESVAQDFVNFNVSITTIESRYTNAPVGQRTRCIVTPTDPITQGTAGGVAFLDSWHLAGSTYDDDVPCWCFGMYEPVNMAQVISHEVGHTLGLSHDGRGNNAYYAGHGNAASSWAPIMGVSYDRRLTQWSIGDYNGATNTEDDIAIIASELNKVGFESDDIPGGFGNWVSLASSSDGLKLAAVARDGRIYLSTNRGVSWAPAEKSRNWSSITCSSDGTKLFATELAGKIHISSDSGLTWNAVEQIRDWVAITSSADGQRLVAAVSGGNLFTSTDAGLTWTERTSASWPVTLTARIWSGLSSSADGTKIVATIDGARIYTSSDSGSTWTARDATRRWSSVASSADGVNLVATVTNGGLIYRSADSGATWTVINNVARDWCSVACSSDGSILYAADFNGLIYKSINAGVNWANQETARQWAVLRSSSNGTNVIAAVSNGIIVTTGNGGTSWTPSIMSDTTAGATINGSFNATGSLHSINDEDWFQFNHSIGASNQNGSFNFSVSPNGSNSNLDLNLAIYNSNGVLVGGSALAGLVANSSPVDSRGASVFGNLPSGVYYLVVRGGSEPFNVAGGNITAGFSSYGAQGNYRITGFFTPVPAIPQIQVQPQSVAAVDGSTITLSVTAIGSGGITYQWLKNGNLMNGERQRTLRLTNMGAVGNEKNGTYTVVVGNATNPSLQVISAPALVTVNYRPRILGITPRGPIKIPAGQPQDLVVSLAPGGTPPFTYTWERVKRPANEVLITRTKPEATDTYTIASANFSSIGTYRVTVTNSTGVVVASSNVVVNVDAPPVILANPANVVIEQGRSGLLTVGAAGFARGLTYRWFKVDRSGASPVETLVSTTTVPRLTILGNPSNAGLYFVRVSNILTTSGGGTFSDVQSSDALVEVDAKPTIATQPASQSLQAGAIGVTLNVSVSGATIGRTFQWFKDGRPYLGAGANTDTLTFAPAISWADRGSYFVEVRNRVGVIRSAAAVLRISSKPVILIPAGPVSMVGATAGSVRFNLSAGGDLPLRYRWFKVGTPDVALTPLPVNSPILTLNRLGSSNAGSYYCQVSNGHPSGSTLSPVITLSVEDSPKVTAITSNFASNNHRAAVGASVSITPTLTGTPPFSFRWFKAGRPITTGIVNPVTGVLQFASSALEDSGAYSVTVTNNTRDVNGRAIEAKSSSLSLSILTPPSIIRVPRDQSVTEGQPVTLSLDALGSPTLQYQWFRVIDVGGTDQLQVMPNQRSRTLSLPKPTPDDSGRYRCRVTNSVGEATSTVATLTISPIPPPTINAFLPTRGTVNELVLLNGANLSYVVSAKLGGRPASVTLLNNNQLYVKVPTGLVDNTPYSIEVTSSGSGGSALSLAQYTYFAKPANDALIDAAILTGTSFGYQGDSTNFTEDLDDPGFLATAWHRWTVPATGRYTLSTRQAFDIAIARYNGIPGSGITIIGNIVDTRLPTTNEQMVFNANAGQNLVFWVGGFNSSNLYPHQGKYGLIMSLSTAIPTYDFDREMDKLTGWVGKFDGSEEVKSIESSKIEDGLIRIGGHGKPMEVPMLIWNEAMTAPPTAKKTIASVKMKLELSDSGTEDRFGWTAVDALKAPIAALWVDAKDGGMYYTSANGVTTDLKQKMISGSLYSIELLHDAVQNQMLVIFDGVILYTDTSLKATSSFSTIYSSYLPSSNTASHGSMVFSDLDVKFE
jgi:hypothetical protein